jgi:hypothetical protein
VVEVDETVTEVDVVVAARVVVDEDVVETEVEVVDRDVATVGINEVVVTGAGGVPNVKEIELLVPAYVAVNCAVPAVELHA